MNLLFTLKNELNIRNAARAIDIAGAASPHPVRSKRKADWNASRLGGALAAIVGLGIQLHAGVIREATEYNIAPTLPGDQLQADLALRPTGGYLVFEDNFGDGDGLAVNLRRVTSTLDGQLNVSSLATITAGNQERPRVSLLAGGGAAFVWQGGPDSQQQVFLRVMTSADQFVGPEVPVSTHADADQNSAAVAGLANGNVAVVWSAYGVDGDMQGVFGAVFNANGQKVGSEFQINQATQFNQRNPAVTALANGGFVVGWVSESQRTENSVDVYARVFSASGTPVANEFRVNTSDRICSSPTIAATDSGNFTVAWCEIEQDIALNGVVVPVRSSSGWDVYSSTFNTAGARLSQPASPLNQKLDGTQKNPSIATVGDTQLVVWTSFGQDGDRESIVGRALKAGGALDGDEFVVNTSTLGRQIMPVVRGNGDGRFVVAWSMFTGIDSDFEIRAQRYSASSVTTLPTPQAPFVSPLSMTRLSVSWPMIDGYDVVNYELYVDGATTPVIVNGVIQTVSVSPSTQHTFAVAYRLRDGRLSPLSTGTSGKAWGTDENLPGYLPDGLPDEWQAKYWGSNSAAWPKATDDTDHDGMSNLEEFLAGTDPTNAASVLKTQALSTPQGPRLSWNTTPGLVYQVQTTSDFETWTNLSGQRFAPGTSDSVSVPVGNSLGYYRVIRLR